LWMQKICSDVPKLGAVAADLGMFQQHVFNSWGAVTAQKN
jgi:hypothetical protein